MDSKLDIPLHGSSLNIVQQCAPALSDILQSKFGCVAIIDGVDFERDPSISQQRGQTFVQENRFTTTLKGGVQLSVWKADLTYFKVDAVVNAANENLMHGGGLAFALSKAGGPQIQKDSEDYIKRCGILKTGDAVVCDPGLLPCKKIIHAVGPRVPYCPTRSEVSKAEPQLEKTIKSILDKVEKYNLKSVAIPAISSGIFNFPLPECASIIVKTVKRYCESSYSGQLPKEIHLVNHDEPTVKEMEKACSQILTNTKGPGGAKGSAPTVQIGNVHLTLKKGKIEEQQTDVIVNTASSQRNLDSGQISGALLSRAGYGMQQEMYRAPSPTGHVIITDSYNLQCKQVYHTFCTDKGITSAQQAAAKQLLFNSVSECLRTAVTKHRSIAFPAIGTGALGFSKNESAKVMSDALAEFAKKCPKKMEVSFVIYPFDDETFKAFEERMVYLQRKASDQSFVHVDVKMSSPPEHRDDLHGSRAPKTPQISLLGPSDETTREAKRWLNGLLSNSSGTVDISNNFVLHFGEKEHQQLSRLMKKGNFIEEFFEKGHARITVNGGSENAVVAALQVEAMLCTIQKQFVTEEEGGMLPGVSTETVPFKREIADSSEKKERPDSKKAGLQILKVEKVENTALKTRFDLKKNQLHIPTSRKMFQRIPAQFCEMVCRIGFHAEYAPPDDPAYGEGIYFAGSVKKALEVWKKQNGLKEEYLYFVEAEVLTGNSTPGRPGIIMPPAGEKESQYHSVSGKDDVSVIFSGYQALPKYIITCKMGEK
ncbi:protein mono-ADP-ribosyltransferase PARP9 [Centropristis striata]|uniref:protein mono-ADP-ribosyltransferase PARP9 n=1 Tax=Centropristis striata TaxID=184440 RepID=UPI0027E0404B|nr:protein mono-ADP-ribosyltransferase PARP9 [Centropristis striata]